ncbi:hypothetical protein RN001_009224 [Aquatica leii]|uniref:Methyltransferase-like protein 22 n=1 Tax=Aquatica leii TaxID=1421715 RepID=A0AAN7SMU0_9COLE|nr:hypothetical protein RN001_009224 [Aquatica leii]
MNDTVYRVSSELYSEFNYETDSKPSVNPSNAVSKFYFTRPALPSKIDNDGDLVVQRRPRNATYVEIEHSKNTTLSLVGLQVWRGALLLADWILHNGSNFPTNSTILELGSGTGLTSIVAAMFSTVICTDVDKGDILKLLKANIERNKSLIRHPAIVGEVNFTKSHTSWDVPNTLDDVNIIIAADVIYDNDLTENFVKTLEFFLLNSKVEYTYVALEKRYVFTTTDCDVSAPCYDFFMECLERLNIAVEELSLDFPQYFQYDRVKELVLIKITCKE